MLEAYKNFWLGYLDFYGRTKRSDYWWVVLINGVIATLIFRFVVCVMPILMLLGLY